jgi:hypothetical protein
VIIEGKGKGRREMTTKRRRLEQNRQQRREAAAFKRTAARRSAVKTTTLAKARDRGDARNAARATGTPSSGRKRKIEPSARKPEAKAKTTIPLPGARE